MNAFHEISKFGLIAVLTIGGLLLNSSVIIAEGDILYEKNYSVNLNESLNIKMSSADVEIVGWNRSEVNIIIEGDESVNDYYDFIFSYKNETIEVITEKKYTLSSWFSSKGYKVKVKVPTEFNLETKTSGGDIEIKKVNGKIELYTSGGDIEVVNSKGSLITKTSGGDIEIKEFEGSTTLKTSGGDIEAKQIRGSVEAKTSGGDIELIVSSGKVIAGTSGGDISLDYEGNNEGVELSTSGGGIYVKLPSDFSADVYLKTSGGSVRNNFSSTKITELSKTKFEGKYNNGGLLFSAKTSGGSIHVNER